jgi:hypothetical protein
MPRPNAMLGVRSRQQHSTLTGPLRYHHLRESLSHLKSALVHFGLEARRAFSGLQSANDASSAFGWTEGQKQIRLDDKKFATVTPEGMFEDIAEGLSMAERRLALAVQGQSYGPMFDENLTVAAWKTKSTWAIVSTKDRMLPPAMEASAAKKM